MIVASEKHNVALNYVTYFVSQHIKTQKSKSVRESVCTVEAGLCSLSVNEKEVAHARLIRVWEV